MGRKGHSLIVAQTASRSFSCDLIASDVGSDESQRSGAVRGADQRAALRRCKPRRPLDLIGRMHGRVVAASTHQIRQEQAADATAPIS